MIDKPTPRFKIFDQVCLSTDLTEGFTITAMAWDKLSGYYRYGMEEIVKDFPSGVPEHILREYIKPFFEWHWTYVTDGGNFGVTETHFTEKEMRNIVFHNRNIISYEKINFTKRMRSK